MKKSSTTNQNNWRMLLEWLLLLLAGWLSISFSEELNKHVLFISTVILLSVISLKVLRIPILKRFLRNHQRFYDSEAAALRHLGVYALWSCFLIGATQLQAQSCNCQDYMYLNDPQDQVSGRGFVHKFRINANGTFTEIPNATTGTLPWIPMGAGLPNPHGLGQDLNGFIYIGESVGSSSRIRKITCDGSILPLSEFNLQADGYNFTSKDGLIYTNPSSSNRIEAYQSCDGSPAGYIRLNGVPHNNGNFVANELQDWGFEITEDGTFYLSAGILDNDGDDIRAVWRFKPTAADFANHTAFSPIFQLDAAHLPPGATPSWVYGITADPTGNMYVNILDLTLPRTTYIVKYNSAGTLVDWTSEEITQDNMGFEASLGIRYYAPLNVLYMTAQFGDCVAAIDAATMEYIGPVVPHVPGQAGKGVAIVRECCPASSPQIVDTTLCNIEVGRKYFLQDLFGGDCDGPICGAVWAAAPGNEGMNFDDCDNSITFTSNTACGTFTASYTPAGPGAQCGAYNLTLNVEAIDLSPPVLGQPPAICAGNDPAAINIITPASSNATIQYQWQSSTVSCSTGFADIPQATIATYDPPVLSQTMYYRVIVSADECSTGENCRDTSNCVPLLVDPCDFGDLPDNGKGVASGDYETSSANEGACHIVSPNLKLGSNVDQDLDGSPEAMAGQMAGGDDNDTDAPNGGDDEDGIANFPMFVSGRTATINVSVMNMLNPLTTAYLYGFIDWNNDGDFSDLGETVVANVASAATSIDLVFNVPVNAALNRKLGARFRISTDDALGANSPNGCAPDGEVEDYMVTVMGFDYGDLADSAPGIGAGNYETQNGNNGPNHKISTDPNTGAVTLKIGSTVDAEGDGQQNANADGDGADDDGVVLPMLEAGVPVDIAVNVMNMTGGDAKLVMFVDWNGDGDFDDTNEMFSVTVPNNATEVTLNDVTPPLDAVLNRNLGIRFRLSDDLAFINNMSSFGPVNGGEVEDYTAQVMGFDYGDLPYNGVALGTGNPVASYATTDTQDGANHKIITDTNGPILKMGATIDNEVDGQPNVDADGDEAIAAPSGDDEDGIANFPLFIPGQVANITVSVMNRGDDATLYGFIDWNKDGLFTGTGETESVAVNAGFMGNVVIAFNVPIDAMADMNLGARFRLTTQNGIGATGSAPDGEVEDYLVRLADLDFGDLADAGTGTGSGNYETVLTSGGAHHVIIAELKIGATIDKEADGAPSAAADGDGADEDGFDPGLAANMLVAGRTTTVTVPLMNMTGTDAKLTVYLDFNNDGDFDDANEMFSTTVVNNASDGTLNIVVPTDAVLGVNIGARFRLTTSTIMSPNGLAPDGEVEDYLVQVMGFDYGDLADSGAGVGEDNHETQDANNGASHKIILGLSIGTALDAEGDGQQSANADGDGADEDGVVNFPMFVTGTPVDITVPVVNSTGGDAKMVLFIDWNNDGDFDDNNEMYSVTVPNNAVDATFDDVTPPLSSDLNTDLGLRIRLSNDPAFLTEMNPNGGYVGGEVEDYLVQTMGFDYGDLVDATPGTATAPGNTPADHETLRADNGPRHKILTDANGNITLKIGNHVDDDADGQPSTDAGETTAGDDNAESPDDEELDAYLEPILFIVTQSTDLQIPVMNTTGANAKLTLYIDFNKDGDFTDTGEMFSTIVANNATVANLTVDVPGDAVVGRDLGFRLRLAGATEPMTPNGVANSGEVEDYMIQVVGYDFGDLPNGYGTQDPNAPKHIISNALKLGASVDVELDGTQEAMAGVMSGGDDNTAGLVTFGTSDPDGDDENGIAFITPMIPGSQSCIEVNAMNMYNSPAVLQMWIDWNGDGDILDAGEAVTTGSFNGAGGGAVVPATSGLTNAKLCFDVPVDAVFAGGGAAFVRFRLSPNGGLQPNTQTGPVPFGEIEDYKVQLGKVGNLVFEDRDFDGTQDAGEPGIQNVTVSLTWLGADGVLGGTDDVTYPTVKTDANGKYYFCGLTDGPGANDNQFKLVFSTPANMTPTRTNQGSQTNGGVADSDGAVTLSPVMDLTMAMETFAFTFPTPTSENSTGDSGTPGVGNFDDNQTDETHDQGFAFLDYGDLPETGGGDDFSTTMGKGGAVHVITPGFKLGASIDGERDGTPSADAFGDVADEDGVTFTSPLIPGNNATISVVSMNLFTSAAVLQGWIDWNNSGTLEAGEALTFTSSVIPTGNATTTFTFPVPADAIFNDGMVFARFRLSPTGGLSANGPDKYGTDPVPQGEVEDYKMNVAKIGNLVWEDYNFDGIQDAGEPGIGSQTVQLVWGGPDGDVTTTGDNQIYSTTTLAAAAGGNIVGEYYFCGLIEGTYKLVALTPADMIPSKTDQADQTNGGLTDNDGIQTGTDLTMIMTALFTITPENLTTQPTGENSTGDNGTAGVGTFPDNESNETYDFAFVSVDFGDLPDSYTTNDDPNNSGAQHIIQPAKYLGTCVDAERDAAVDAVAGLRGAGDDGAASSRTQGSCTTPNDDENGVEFLTPLVPGYEACVRVTYTAIDQPGLTRDGKTYLSAWIDYNGNGQFDSGEQVISDASLAVGTGVVRTFCFTVPGTATFAGGAIRARFRLHCEPGLGSAGVAVGGEVEDYHIPVAKAGNYVWFDNDLRGDQSTTDSPRDFADEQGVNGLSLVLVWYGEDGQFDTDDDRVYIKQTANGNQGETEDDGDPAAGIYYFCGLQKGEFRIVPLKYATLVNVGVGSITASDGIIYDVSDAIAIGVDNGTYLSVQRDDFEVARKVLTFANQAPATDGVDSDAEPVTRFAVPNLLVDGLRSDENGVGDIPAVYNYPDTLTELALDMGLIQEPNIEIVQSVVGVDKAASGDCENFNMIVDLCIKNTGVSGDGKMGVPLNNLQASIDLAGQLGAIFKNVVAKPVLIKTEAERKYIGDPLLDPQAFPNLNMGFNGNSDQNLFDGASGLLWPGEKILVRYVLEVAPNDVDMMVALNAAWNANVRGEAVNYQGLPVPNYFDGGAQYVVEDVSDDARAIDGTYNDGDDATPFGDCWKKVKETATLNVVNIGLQADCKVEISANMLIKPYHPECDTMGLPLGGFYRFTLADMNGKPLANPIDAKCLAQMKAKYLLERIGVCEPLWGEFNLEDKAGPNIVSALFAPDSILCKDLNLILNNSKSIGTPGADFRSPKQNERTFDAKNHNLVNDELMNLGMVTFRENCDCNNVCPVIVKWTDKLETYGCDSINQKGVWGRIYREWVATDCRDMRKDTIQVIVVKRPLVEDFQFVNTTRGGVKTQSGAAAGAPTYDWTVEHNNCSADKTLIQKADWMPSLLSKFHNPTALPLRPYLDEIECNYSVQIKDTEFPICGGKGLKIDREVYIFDWCAGGIIDTLHILIKIGDFETPKLVYERHAPNALSTGPMDCTAAFSISAAGIKSTFGVAVTDNCGVANVSVRIKTKDRYVKGILMATDTWEQVEYAVMNGLMTGLPVGRHRLIITAYDGCYNASRDSFEFEVVDKIAPVMVCDDQLNVSLSNANGYTSGYAQVTAADVDEGSRDNCKLEWIRVRRNVPDNCSASFIAKGYDSNGNGKLDPMPADGDWTKADGFDINGDGDLADFGETFILKDGKLLTPLQDIAEFFCCDVAEKVTVELWGEDASGNRNFCWKEVQLEDKVAPTCLAPWDVTIDCDDKGLEKIDDRIASSELWGDVTVTSGADCAVLDIVYSTVKSLKCGAGWIDRIWTMTKQTAKGPITITCKQRISIRAIREYNICFPKDASSDCKTPIIDTVLVDELACDILAVNVTDKRYDAAQDECYKIFRTYTVIDWCAYDDRCGDPTAEGSVYVVNRATFENYGKAPIYVLVRDKDRNGTEEFYLSKDLVPNNSGDQAFIPPYCEASAEFYHSFMYTQIIKVYDNERPVVTSIRDTFCTSPTACVASVTKVLTIKDNCTDLVELERQQLMIAPFQTLDAGAMILYSTPRWSVKELGNGQFEITVSNVPEGLHDLIVVGRDECGNLSVATRIPFIVKDCKAPAPICINGLSTELMPVGNGAGMMAVWAKDFVASPIYDCNGQGPETKDGLKVITKYSINRVGEAARPDQTSLTLNCNDAGKVILVELHAWDERGNHDFCVTFIEVQDNRKVCGTAENLGAISGLITTDDLEPVLGVGVELSGGAQMAYNTGTNGGFNFNNLTKGGDFTVTAQMDKDHLNGVSTFDLVLLQKHILGSQLLNNPYRLIAADVNNSKSISTLDMIQIRKLILGIDTKFTSVPSWKFVDANYRFTSSANPWADSFPEVVNVNDLAGSVKADFIAIKMGDVNGNASASGAVASEIRGAKDMILSTPEQTLKAGQTYEVPFRAKDLAQLQGFQFTLQVAEKAEIIGLDYGVMKAENFGLFQNEGIITTSFVRAPLAGALGQGHPQGMSLQDDAILFTLKLKANTASNLSEVLDINSRRTNIEAYNQYNDVMEVQLSFGNSSSHDQAALYQNTPNPFAYATSIGFYLPSATRAVLTVRDVKGALIYKVEGNYAKGNNQVILKQEQLRASGVMYYTLETNDFVDTKKMILLQK